MNASVTKRSVLVVTYHDKYRFVSYIVSDSKGGANDSVLQKRNKYTRGEKYPLLSVRIRAAGATHQTLRRNG
jgi:hypothetical protein